MKPKTFMLWLALASTTLLALMPTIAYPLEAEPTSDGNITFTPNVIPSVNVTYDDYTFVFEYKTYFIRVAPFVIYDGKYHGLWQIVRFLKRTYPNVNYKWLLNKATRVIHYGFNLTRLPQNVADKIDYLGFRLVDLNFPLKLFELETIWDMENEWNITRIRIPKANLVFSFEDLYPNGYSVEHVNSTWILIGNVRGKQDLFIDPITFSDNIITVTGYTKDSPCTFWDLWNASWTNGWNVSCQTCENATTGLGHQDAQFLFACSIQIGDASTTTWFNDTDKQIHFSDVATGNYFIIIRVKYKATITLGQLDDDAGERTSHGCHITSDNGYYLPYLFYSSDAGGFAGTIYLWDCSFSSSNLHGVFISGIGVFKAYNNIWTKLRPVQLMSTNRLHRHKQSEADLGYARYDGVFENVNLYDALYIVYTASSFNVYVKDTYARGLTYIMATSSSSPWTGTGYYINVDSDTWTFNWGTGATGELHRQYEFDLRAIFENQTAISNLNISLTDVDGLEVFNIQTDANGEISTQTVTYAFYNRTGGNTPYLKSPHTLKAFKEGIRMYKSVFNITEKTKWTLTLTPRGWHTGTEGITFQENAIPKTHTSYSNYTFYFRYKDYYLGLRPFAIYNDEIYSAKKIVSYLKSQGATYTWAFRKAKQMIHYGFNVTGIPPHIASNLDYLGFKVVDYNFPLSEIKKEIIEVDNFTYTRLHIPKANLHLSFEDLQERGYTVHFINRTYLLIGNVNRTDLDIDPITYSSPLIKIDGFTENDPCTFQHVCDENDANGWGVVDAIGDNEFIFHCLLVVGSGSTRTWFIDTDKQITFADDSTDLSHTYLIEVRGNATFRVGQLDDATKKFTSHGCSFISESQYSDTRFVFGTGVNLTIQLYHSTFTSLTLYHSIRAPNAYVMKVYDCLLDNVKLIDLTNADIHNVHITNVETGISSQLTSSTVEKLTVQNVTYGVKTTLAYGINLTDSTFSGVTYYILRGYSMYDSYFVDVTYTEGGSGTAWISGSGDLYIQWSFDLRVAYPNGTAINGTATGCRVVIRHYGQAYTVDYNSTLEGDGTIPTQTLSQKYYDIGADAVNNYNPYNLYIYNVTDYESYSENFTLVEAVDWNTALQSEEKLDPIARFTYSPSNPGINNPISFSASDSLDPDGGSLASYSWTFGDGTSDTGVSVTKNYSNPSIYTVTLTVTDDEGATDTFSLDVNVESPGGFYDAIREVEKEKIVYRDVPVRMIQRDEAFIILCCVGLLIAGFSWNKLKKRKKKILKSIRDDFEHADWG